MEEVWKDVPGYNGKYQVSNLGNIASNDWKNTKQRHILIPQNNGNGYYSFGFRNKGKKEYRYIHRLVAEAFIPNPDNLPQVNHIDEDKTNNRVDNLEWCDAKYNLSYGSRKEREISTQRLTHPSKKAVIQFSFDNQPLSFFTSQREAQRNTGISSTDISNCCLGKLQSAGGYRWRFSNDFHPFILRLYRDILLFPRRVPSVLPLRGTGGVHPS